MSVHIVMSRPLGSSLREGPRHSMRMLAEQMDATIHAPESGRVNLSERLRALCFPDAQHWALGAALRDQLSASDSVLCTGEIPGFQVAAALGGRRTSPRLAVMVHNIIRPRAIAAMKIWRLHRRISKFMAVSAPQIGFLKKSFGVDEDRLLLVADHTDTLFFSPGPSSAKRRPLIVSVGLEQRDYVTLAEATRGMDVDVRISGFSKDARIRRGTLPEPFPENMSAQYYSWRDLLQLYRDADVVVVSTRACTYAAGVQGLLEAMACGRPVVVTASQGLTGYMDDRASVQVAPQNPHAMREAIQHLLDNPATARAMGEAGRRIASERYNMESYVAAMKSALEF
ncbi:MAG: glycosyltransferase family 4 protein [Pseudomonadota bacterium]